MLILAFAANGRYMVSAPTTNIELSTDLTWRINYIQCCVPLILELWKITKTY